MAKIKNNPLVKGLSGMVGGTIVFRQVRGRTVISNAPPERGKGTKKQKAHNAKFTKASRYAKHQTTHRETRAEYAKGITARKANTYTVAVADYMNPPEVHYVKAPGYMGAVGDTISIKATDDFKVVSVSVVVVNTEGKELERGDAIQNARKKFMWKYKTAVENPNIKGTVIKVRAMDLPGNKTPAETVL